MTGPADSTITGLTAVSTLSGSEVLPLDQSSGGATNSRKVGVSLLQPVINVLWYGATGDGSTDDTTAINSAYDAAAAVDKPLYFPPGTYKITSQLDFDSSVDILGANRENTIFSAAGTFDAIRIGGASAIGQESLYENFTVDRASGTGKGIVVYAGARITMRRITARDQSSHGIELQTGNLGTYQSIRCLSNGGDGFKINSGAGYGSGSAWACTFSDIDCLSNTGVGFNIDVGNSHFGTGVVCQNNTGVGFRSNANTNIFQVYTESNTAADIHLTSSSVRNFITANNVDAFSALGILDEGTNNTILDIAIGVVFSTPSIGPYKKVAGTAGADQSITAGTAYSGGSAAAGGRLLMEGGAASGTGNANGGEIRVTGGAPVGSGVYGDVVVGTSTPALRPQTSGGPNLGSGSFLWAEVFAVNGTINTSDAAIKTVRGSLTVEELRVAKTIASQVLAYRWNDAIEAKGDAARIHFGILAQNVKAAFEAEGLNPFAYAMLCKDALYEEVSHEDQSGIAEGKPPRTKLIPKLGPDGQQVERYGVRYSELAMFVVAAQEQRLAALESK